MFKFLFASLLLVLAAGLYAHNVDDFCIDPFTTLSDDDLSGIWLDTSQGGQGLSIAQNCNGFGIFLFIWERDVTDGVITVKQQWYTTTIESTLFVFNAVTNRQEIELTFNRADPVQTYIENGLPDDSGNVSMSADPPTFPGLLVLNSENICFSPLPIEGCPVDGLILEFVDGAEVDRSFSLTRIF